jgi:transcriptional regulator with XRE-family HTH domain
MASPIGKRVLQVWRRALGVVLAESRNASAFSQEDLAGKTGLNRKFISSVENGRQAPGFDALVKIAVATQVSIDEMFSRVERLAASESLLEAFAGHTASKNSQGMTTCPNCEALYERYTRKLTAQKRGHFKCRFCKERLASWRPPEPVILHEVRRLPPKLRREK